MDCGQRPLALWSRMTATFLPLKKAFDTYVAPFPVDHDTYHGKHLRPCVRQFVDYFHSSRRRLKFSIIKQGRGAGCIA